MKQLFVIVLLALGLAGCDSASGGNYAAQLRAKASGGQAPPSTFNNGLPGEQKATIGQGATQVQPPPPLPPMPGKGEKSQASSWVDSIKNIVPESTDSTEWRDTSQDADPSEVLASVVAFFGSTPLFFWFCVVAFSLVVRRKVRK